LLQAEKQQLEGNLVVVSAWDFGLWLHCKTIHLHCLFTAVMTATNPKQNLYLGPH